MKKYAIIVAGGSGSRMGTDLPKQFIELAGKPILMHTISQFLKASTNIEITLVLPQSQVEFWQELVKKHQFNIQHSIVHGGESRFQSVRNGLDSIANNNGLVAIHDGVRPFISGEIILDSYQKATVFGSSVVSVPLKDSIRQVGTDGENQARERSQFRAIQTPQTFQIELLKKAFLAQESSLFTDDASVFEHAGHTIHLAEGDYRNIKITTPEDLLIAEAFVKDWVF